MTALINLDVPRNGHFLREYELCDADGAPIDLNGATVESSARNEPGGASTLAAATITIVEPSAGRFTLLWDGSDFDAYGSLTEIAVASYDIKVTVSGVILVPMRGMLHLLPENTA